jgi:hypothetical protein
MIESLDLSREGMRTESLNSYVIVSVLTAAASFETVLGEGPRFLEPE